jgi:aryl-alcohol dehydrogenase-like predicted oxidoreductase
MVHRDLEQDLLPVCIANNIAVISYSSLALGLLTGAIGPDRKFKGDDLRINDRRFSVANRRKVAAFVADIAPLAKARDASIAELVIAWTLSQPGITFALCGARNAAQARENAKAGFQHLTSTDRDAISMAVQRHLEGIHV